jgi:hypothetical protein
MTLHATAVLGDPAVMMECLIQEYAGMGWGAEPILGLFQDPAYPALHGLWLAWGERAIRERVHGILARSGVLRFTGSVNDDPSPELVEVGTGRIHNSAEREERRA